MLPRAVTSLGPVHWKLSLLVACVLPHFHAQPARAAGADIVELSHDVDVQLQDGAAVVRVRRAYRNLGSRADRLRQIVTLPPNATVDGLRVRSGRQFYDGQLLNSAEAEAKFKVLHSDSPSAIGETTAPPVLLAWLPPNKVQFEVAALLPRKRVWVEYTFLAPTCYAEGRHWFQYPSATGPGAHKPRIRVNGHRGRRHDTMPQSDTVAHACHKTREAATIVSYPATTTQMVEMRWGTASLGERSIGRLEFELRVPLRPKPKKPTVVFVLDGSHSLGDARLRQQLGLVHGYLRHVPDAMVQIIVARRKAKSLFKRLVRAQSLKAKLRRVPNHLRELGNGSHLELGLQMAANILAQTTGPARVVAFTDTRLRSTFDNALALKALQSLPKQAIVHLVDYQRSEGKFLERPVTAHDLQTIAFSHGGTLFDIRGQRGSLSERARLMLPLVRPTRIDNPAIEANGLFTLHAGDALKEGTGLQATTIGLDVPKRVKLTGRVWGTPWEKMVETSIVFSKKVPALSLGDPITRSLAENEVVTLARFAGAVSDFTSYLASDQERLFAVGSKLSESGGYGWGSSGL